MAARSVSSMASITRNAVGTEATAPKTSACRRRPSRFARASPPPAMVTARSELTLPGSCRRRRWRIGASGCDRASVSPERSAISASRRLPAWVASPLPSAVTFNAGRHLVAFTWYVPSCLGSWCLDNPIFPGQEGFFADLPPLHSTVNERCGLRFNGECGAELRRDEPAEPARDVGRERECRDVTPARHAWGEVHEQAAGEEGGLGSPAPHQRLSRAGAVPGQASKVFENRSLRRPLHGGAEPAGHAHGLLIGKPVDGVDGFEAPRRQQVSAARPEGEEVVARQRALHLLCPCRSGSGHREELKQAS